jgi:16S rRNA (cytosine967-C5)-methyltransferase
MLRHKLKSIEWNVKDATKDEFELADGILIDAPCTGTGVIGKHPDIKWRRTMVNIHEMANIQLAILNHVSNYLKPGGRLVYSTCSLEPEENWNVINAFLKLSPKFELDMNTLDEHNHWVDSHGTLQTLPHRDKTDGMYAARLIKN